MTLDNLIDEAKKLTHAEQAELLDELLCLVGPEAADVALTPEQQEDLDRRIEEFRSGNAKLIPGDEAIAAEEPNLMLPYEFTDRAERDLRTARTWYDRHSLDLGNRFVDAVLLAIRAVRERPNSFPIVRSGVRAVRCRRFPYRMYFEASTDRVIVLAVYHTARRPQGWDDPDRD